MQIVLSSKKIHGKVKLSFIFINISCFLSGIILPLVATYIFIGGISPDIKCITGIEVIALLGFFITIVTTPIIATVSYINYRSKQNGRKLMLNGSYVCL
ncbi:hypothetical protein [Mucilaginibacter terrigena]|uniref:hypothetical protein n=1 Tax=Mucilaginibacter terrigena TaxID=2492395 RepID=UPI00101F7F89|nr:hypothetical protein [Mucilaginibacter terrigena]